MLLILQEPGPTDELITSIAGSGSPSTTAMVLALVLALTTVRILDRVLLRFMPRGWGGSGGGSEPPCSWKEGDRAQLQQLFDWHARFGPDGNPVWYNSHDPKLLDSIAAAMHKVAEVQRDTLRIVERLDRRLDEHP